MEKPTIKIMAFYESKLDSVIADLTTTVMFALLFWFNYKFIGGNNLIDFFCLLVIASKGFAYLKGKRTLITNKLDAQKYIDSIYSQS